MQPLLLIQAGGYGLRDLSSHARLLSSSMSRLSIIDGHHYYDLGGDTAVRWQVDKRLPLTTKKMTIEGWMLSTVSKADPGQFLLGGFEGNNYAKGFYLGINADGFIFPTGDGTRDYPRYDAVNANTPMHFAWVMDGVNKSLYINGVLFQSDVMQYGITMPEALTFGFAYPDNSTVTSPSFAKLHQLIIWDGAKYTENFTAEYINYEQQDLAVADLLPMGHIVPSDYSGQIVGQVLEQNIPIARKVCAYHRGTNELIAVTWSDRLGNYSFDNLRPNTEYYVVSFDHERDFNAVIQDMIKAEK